MKVITRIFGLLLITFGLYAKADSALVAVSSNMSHAIKDIANQFEQHTSHKLKLSFGSSGNLTHQILNGSPHELFLSANADYVNELKTKNKTLPNNKTYAIGSLCAYIPHGSHLKSISHFEKLLTKILFGQFQKLVVANPLIAPYGNAAIETLQNSGVWSFDQSKLVIAENASQATQFAYKTPVDMAFIPLSHYKVEKIRSKGKCIEIPSHLHQPIEQQMVLTRKASNVAKLFYNFMTSDTAQSILINYGYHLPTI